MWRRAVSQSRRAVGSSHLVDSHLRRPRDWPVVYIVLAALGALGLLALVYMPIHQVDSEVIKRLLVAMKGALGLLALVYAYSSGGFGSDKEALSRNEGQVLRGAVLVRAATQPGVSWLLGTKAWCKRRLQTEAAVLFHCGGMALCLGTLLLVRWSSGEKHVLTVAADRRAQTGSGLGVHFIFSCICGCCYERIVDWLAASFKNDEGIDLLKDKQDLQRLTKTAEKAKMELSSLTQTNISLPFITATAEGPKHIETTITRAKFEELY